MRSRSLVIHATMAMMLFPACGVPVVYQKTWTEAVSPPGEARLRARLAEFHNALGANDIAKWHAMTTPDIRDKMTLEDFKKDMRWDENAGRRKETTMAAELGRACSCTSMKNLRCALIADAGGRIKKEQSLEMWEYAGGEWYWGYREPRPLPRRALTARCEGPDQIRAINGAVM